MNDFNYVQLKLEKNTELTQKYKALALEPFSSPAQVYKASRAVIGDNAQESLILWGTDVRNQPIMLTTVGIGDLVSTPAPPAPILKTLLLSAATRGFVVHNHPSGISSDESLEASKQDVEFSQHLSDLCDECNLMLADSLIICPNRYLSLRQEGLLHTGH